MWHWYTNQSQQVSYTCKYNTREVIITTTLTIHGDQIVTITHGAMEVIVKAGEII